VEQRKENATRTISVVMILTLVGKVMGLYRDHLLALHYGMGMEANAFYTASRIPRVFFDAMFASAISACFIPVFSEYLTREGREKAFAFSRTFLTAIGILSAVLSGVGMVFSGPLTELFADGYNAETAALAVELTRIMFPTVFFTGLAFTFVGILQSLDEFRIPALISAVSNAVIILYFLFLDRSFGVYGLAVAFLVGWLLQAVVQVPKLRRLGFRYRPALRHPGLKQVFVLMLPVMVSTWIQPVNQLISTRFATHLFHGAGASAMDYANTLYTIVTGILVLSITNVLFPEMSRLSTIGKEEELGQLIVTNIRGMLFLLLPLTVGVMLMSEPLVRLLYEWKSWDSFSTVITARALSFMSLGMVGYGIQNVLSRAFYADRDGKTPLISGVISIAVNLILCILLSDSMDVAGLSLATAVSSGISALILLAPTVRRFPKLWNRAFWSGILKMALCSGIMGIVVFLVHSLLAGVLTDSLVSRIMLLGIPALCGIVVYFTAALALHLQELDVLRKIIKR